MPIFKKRVRGYKRCQDKKIVNRSSQGKKVTLLLKILEICNCEELRMLHILDPDYFGLPLVPFLTICCLSLCGQNNLVVSYTRNLWGCTNRPPASINSNVKNEFRKHLNLY